MRRAHNARRCGGCPGIIDGIRLRIRIPLTTGHSPYDSDKTWTCTKHTERTSRVRPHPAASMPTRTYGRSCPHHLTRHRLHSSLTHSDVGGWLAYKCADLKMWACRPRADAKICPRASAGVLKSGPGSRWSSKIWPLSPKIVTTWHVTEIFASRRCAARATFICCGAPRARPARSLAYENC